MKVLNITSLGNVTHIEYNLEKDDYSEEDVHLWQPDKVLKASTRCKGCERNHLGYAELEKVIKHCRMHGHYCHLCLAEVNRRLKPV